MPKSLVSRLMKPFLISLMLIALVHCLGLSVKAEEAAQPTAEETAPVNGKPDTSLITDTPIKNGNTQKHLKNMAIHVEKPGANVRVHPPSIAITVLGPPPEPKADEALRQAAFVYIDAEGLAPGIYVRPARIILPDGYVLIDAAPELFVLEITAAKDAAP